jgi:adenosine deaminase
MSQHNLKRMLNLGLCVTVNSDDPAYFGGYIEENFRALHEGLGLDHQDIYQLSSNAFRASFLNPAEKKKYMDELDAYMACFRQPA